MGDETKPKLLHMRDDLTPLVIQLVRNYDRFKEQADAIITQGLAIRTDGDKTKTSSIPDPTATAAAKRERILADVAIIEAARDSIPEEYRATIWAWVKGHPLNRLPMFPYASRGTWYNQKAKFLTDIARREGWLINHEEEGRP